MSVCVAAIVAMRAGGGVPVVPEYMHVAGDCGVVVPAHDRQAESILEANELFTIPVQPRVGSAERVQVLFRIGQFANFVRIDKPLGKVCTVSGEGYVDATHFFVSLSSVGYHVFALRKIII